MFVTFLIGVVIGVALLYWYNQSEQSKRRRIPKEWPLRIRPLVNNREKKVWLWLSKVMFDQQILIKLPVTRFTAPSDLKDARHWYQLLNGVYCTFTVCNTDGLVIGCVDVPAPGGLSMSNQMLKHNLLTNIGIHYLVVDPDNLPHLIWIRTAFLGEHAARDGGGSHLDSRIKDVSENLHAIVDRKRHSKTRTAAQLDAAEPNATASEYSEGQLAAGWEQNSFVTPLDSRMADLGR
jgi:hypothetical protein